MILHSKGGDYMSMIQKLFGNDKNTNRPVNNDPFFDVIYNYFDNGNDDFDVDDKGVINISSDIYAITSRIANDIANVPISSSNSYVNNLLNNHINQYMSARDWEVATLMNLLIYGDSFSLIETCKNGTISDIQFLPTYDVTVFENAKGLSYEVTPTQTTYQDNRILHFKLNSLNGLVGTSPLLALKNTLKLSRASNRLLRSYYDNSAFNKVLLQTEDKLSSKDRAKIKKAFSDNLGSRHAGGTIVSDDSVKVTPFNTSNVGANVIKETKNGDYFAKKIASVYGVPASLLGVVNPHSNGADVMDQYHQDLRSYENVIISELNNKLQGNYTIGSFIKVNNATDVANLAKAGAITPTQAQTMLGIN